MKVLHRAKHLYTDTYFTSESIKFEFNQMYLYFLQEHRWVECEQDTRSINFEDMLDKNGVKIFASLSEDGEGGDYYEDENGFNYIAKYQQRAFRYSHAGIEVTGIYKGDQQ